MEQRVAIFKTPYVSEIGYTLRLANVIPSSFGKSRYKITEPAMLLAPQEVVRLRHAVEDWQSHNGCIGSPLISPLLDVRQIWPSSDI